MTWRQERTRLKDGEEQRRKMEDDCAACYSYVWTSLDQVHAQMQDESNADGALDDETFKSHLQWRELVMRARQNDKGEWSYVYVTQVDGQDYTLLNKGARFLQTGLLET